MRKNKMCAENYREMHSWQVFVLNITNEMQNESTNTLPDVQQRVQIKFIKKKQYRIMKINEKPTDT